MAFIVITSQTLWRVDMNSNLDLGLKLQNWGWPNALHFYIRYLLRWISWNHRDLWLLQEGPVIITIIHNFIEWMQGFVAVCLKITSSEATTKWSRFEKLNTQCVVSGVNDWKLQGNINFTTAMGFRLVNRLSFKGLMPCRASSIDEALMFVLLYTHLGK